MIEDWTAANSAGPMLGSAETSGNRLAGSTTSTNGAADPTVCDGKDRNEANISAISTHLSLCN